MIKLMLIGGLLCFGGASTTPKEVYCTKSGKKYHTHKDCRYLKGKDYKTITLAEAKKDKMEKCSVCSYRDLSTTK